MIKPDR